MSLYKKASPEIQKMADEFIEQIKDGTIVKRKIYPIEEALESFKSLSSNEEMEEIMIDSYK